MLNVVNAVFEAVLRYGLWIVEEKPPSVFFKKIIPVQTKLPFLPVRIPFLYEPCEGFQIKVVAPDIAFINTLMVAGVEGGVV